MANRSPTQIFKRAFNEDTDRIKTESSGEVIDFLDAELFSAADDGPIPGSASAPIEVVASLADAASLLVIVSSLTQFSGLYREVTAGIWTLVAIFGPGMDRDVPVSIPAGARLGLRAMESAAITSGKLAVHFIG